MALTSDDRRRDTAAIKASVSLLDIAQRYGLKLRREGREWRGLSPFKPERTPSFYIDPQKQLFNCFASGEGGDVIRFVQLMDGCDFKTAIAKLLGLAGIDDPVERRRRAAEYEARRKSEDEKQAERLARQIGMANAIWQHATPGAETPVETYLREARRIDLDALHRVYGWAVSPALRFHASVRYFHAEPRIEWTGPAMVGICERNIRGYEHMTGLHRTWLAPDGRGKAALPTPKKTMGSLMGAMTLLSPVCADAVLGEGYETTLAVMAALAAAGRRVCGISGLFLGNICGAGIRREGAPRGEIPVDPDPARPGLMLPEGVQRVILLKDADGREPEKIDRHLRRAATKFQRAGVRVLIASPTLGDDFNDMTIREAA